MNIVKVLKAERSQLQRELSQLDEAIAALTKRRKKRTLSAAARARISQAQKKRWAKAKKT